MFKKLFIIFLLLITGFYVVSQENVKTIFAGIAIFLIGMHFMEDGFKLFSGGTLEKILEKFTQNNYRSLLTGFISTSIVQSSSLISVIVISFLSVEIISLSQGLAIIFGANLGSTTTAWIVSALGLNIKISLYAMPMIIFGVIFRFSKNGTYVGLGDILLGLGFIFLGISYMKEGFETLKDAIDLSQYAMQGALGIAIYVVIGAIATVIIQSSGATMAIIITALAGGNILYIDALALAIGANVGTTVTAVLGSLSSNQNGKRLAFGHFVFNMITGLIALIFIYALKDLVDILSPYLGISENSYSMKLALFHTIFNILGISLLLPFIPLIVKVSKNVINDDKYKKSSKPKYLSKENIKIPYNAMVSIRKEVINLYENAQKAILHAISIHTSELKTKEDLEKLPNKTSTKIDTNLDDIYQNNLKLLYSEIIEFSLVSQQHMNKEQNEYVTQLKLASNIIVKILKDTRDIQKNMNFYLNSRNEYIKQEYIQIRQELASFIFEVNQLNNEELDEVETSALIQSNKDRRTTLDIENSKRVDDLIRTEKITSKMATSLINDSTTTSNICKNLLRIANIMFIRDEQLRKLGESDET
ncbi:Na/Pi cotransporter family protein [Halarcobacter anaerophilus]|uniref:Sodium:pantothenate symporter n=1 Tax=Halarcobacter anaerophilus TaxID=877500 RepID=A0A4Q0Y7C5_9BACT|nr:Na/Pi symporter [Halarcobacter anaerophilus]QDF29146.1 sodium:phosphate symporter [Halarcobacter anaerophilus]RXJ64401.1 sodium:pantothenate symporter [Halarcobacter anaerophilus]